MTLQPQFIILPLVVVLVVALTLVCFKMASRAMRKPSEFRFVARSWSDSGWSIAAILGSVFGGILLLATLGAMVPFNPTYWTYNHVQGTVASVSNRFVSGTGDTSSDDYVVSLSSQPGVFNVQDDRIQGVKIGDRVDLTCTVQWVYQGQDQNNCFIRSWAVTR